MTHGINQDYRSTFWEINVLRLTQPEIILKEFHLTTRKETEKQSLKQKGGSLTTEDGQNYGTIPMPTFSTKPWTTSSTMPVELPQNYIVGQQRQHISELQFDKSRNPRLSLVWKVRFKTQVTTCSDFPWDAMLWIKEVEMVDSLDELKCSPSVYGKDFPNFEMLDAKIASALNKIIQNCHFKKKVSLVEQKAQKGTGFYEEDRSPS